MGITSGKKEKEKKRLQKRRDKEERKAERKLNSNKGKGFEDMLAYVDEYGNFSSTPPDPAKKIVVNHEDIQIGVPKQAEVDPADLIRSGTVSFFNDSKGYGFIRDNNSKESFFVHINALTGPIKENDKVTFEVEWGMKGMNAVNVKTETA